MVVDIRSGVTFSEHISALSQHIYVFVQHKTITVKNIALKKNNVFFFIFATVTQTVWKNNSISLSKVSLNGE